MGVGYVDVVIEFSNKETINEERVKNQGPLKE